MRPSTLFIAAAALAAAPAAARDTAPEDDSAAWRAVAPKNLLLLELPEGDVAVELAPQFAPEAAAQMRALARSGHYDEGASFYRVIDNFVAQGGVCIGENCEGDDGAPALPAEYERAIGDLTFTPLGNADLFAPEAGHIGGFAAGRDGDTVWPLHCYGAMAMARDNPPSAGSSHFYIVNGQAPRHLDRNLTVFGRVIDGMDLVQAVTHAEPDNPAGVIPEVRTRTPILSVKLASELPEDERPSYEVMRTDSAAFEALKTSKRVRDGEFWLRKPPEIVDICTLVVPVRQTDAASPAAPD